MVARNTALLERPSTTLVLKKRRVVRAAKTVAEPLLAKVKAALQPAVVPVDYIGNPLFDERNAADTIMASLPDAKPARQPKAPEGLPPYLASLYEVGLLNREQEAHLFRQMNFLRHKAYSLRTKKRTSTSDLTKAQELSEQAQQIKNRLVRANLRLVVSIAKKHVRPTNDFFELVSDGNMSLIRAVEKFDYSRGNKFSTYASWAIMKNFARTIPEEHTRRDRFVTGQEAMFDAAADRRGDEGEAEAAHKRMRDIVGGMLGKLDPRERRIIISRYGLDGNVEQTLEQLGNELGVTKERVRQLETRAQAKLKKFATSEAMEMLAN